jgi:hypothetical protein
MKEAEMTKTFFRMDQVTGEVGRSGMKLTGARILVLTLLQMFRKSRGISRWNISRC